MDENKSKDTDGVGATSDLHGKHTLENKAGLSDNEANRVDLQEDMAREVRKAVTLDYLEGGGDGKGDAVSSRISKFKSNNSEWIDHSEVDELYPTHKD